MIDLLKHYAYPKSLLHIFTILSEHHYQAYIVGGAVRNILLGRIPTEFDLTTSATPEIIASLFTVTSKRGQAYGSVMVRSGSETYEITTFREESGYSDHRHPDHVWFTGDIHRDLTRRDFTINALVYQPITHEFIDDFGGISDLKKKSIKCIGDPLVRFNEDVVRMLRAIRFSHELQFSLAPDTAKALDELKSMIQLLPSGRIKQELKGINWP